ncbi:nucleolar protein 11 [Caerostris darwini]|uniref:Nucleolar protein 11 n=1 Tax=Caerostris darwini TaxID=1538125 RepID=A0AAV4T682_9ARAC|nr:nucleolar protein 11 [Caerostris darwini]
MEKFGEESSSICAVKNFYRLPIALREKGCYLINDSNRSIAKIRDKKLVHSWRLKHPHYFTCPIVFDTKNESLYCVMDNNIILQWMDSNVEDDVLSNASKFKFQETIFGVIPVHGHKPLILFDSGRVICGELTSNSVPVGENIIKESEKIIWADAVELNSKICVACLSKKSEKNSYQLHYFNVEENGVTNYENHSINNETGVLKNWCLNKTTHSFLTIWSNGLILNFDLQTQTESNLLTLSSVENHLLAMHYVGSNYLIILKCNQNVKETCLELWDIKFKVLKARKELKNKSSTDNKISVINSFVFFSNNGDLIQVPYHVKKSTLSAVFCKSFESNAKVAEESWDGEKLSNAKHNAVEEMDTSEINQEMYDSTELLAQSLMKNSSTSLKIQESDLVKLLHYAIRTKKEANIDSSILLNAVFSAEFNDDFLSNNLRKLDLNTKMPALKVILSMLQNKKSSEDRQEPSEIQLFRWLFLIIYSDIEALSRTTDKKCKTLIRKLYKCISEKMKDDDEEIMDLLLILKNKNFVLKDYVIESCIETIDL